MVAPFTLFIAIGCTAIAAWALLRLLRGQPVILKQLLWSGVVEALLLIQIIVAGVLLALGAEVSEPAVLWGYLITVPLILPAAGAWAFADRSRWSSAVLLVAAITVGVLQWRLVQVWAA